MSNSKNPRKRRAWPAKRRAAQARRCSDSKPWEHNTGPKTEAGKARASQNALKTGYYSADMAELRRVLRTQKAFVKRALGSTLSTKSGSTDP